MLKLLRLNIFLVSLFVLLTLPYQVLAQEDDDDDSENQIDGTDFNCQIKCEKTIEDNTGGQQGGNQSDLKCSYKDCTGCYERFQDEYDTCQYCEVNYEKNQQEDVINYKCISTDKENKKKYEYNLLGQRFFVNHGQVGVETGGGQKVYSKSDYEDIDNTDKFLESCKTYNENWLECINTPRLISDQYTTAIHPTACISSWGRYKFSNGTYVPQEYYDIPNYKYYLTPFCCPFDCQSCHIDLDDDATQYQKVDQEYYYIATYSFGKSEPDLKKEALKYFYTQEQINAPGFDSDSLEANEYFEIYKKQEHYTLWIKLKPLIVCDSCPRNRIMKNDNCECVPGTVSVNFQSECENQNPLLCGRSDKKTSEYDFWDHHCCVRNENCETCAEDGKTCTKCKQSDSEYRGPQPACQCLAGSYVSKADFNGKSTPTGGCEPCPFGQYQFQPGQYECLPCPEGPFICRGGNKIEIKEGFWRASNKSIEYQECLDNNGNCLGGLGAGDDICKKGYVGPLCETCDPSGDEPYTFQGDRQCAKCSESLIAFPMIIGLLIFRFYCMYISVGSTLSAIEDKVGFNSLKILFNTHEPTPDQNATLMKILQNYLFYIGIITSFELDMPSGFSSFVKAVSNPLKMMAYAFDCSTYGGSMPNIYFRIIFQHIIIIGEYLFVLVVFLGVKKIEKNKTSFKAFACVTGLYQFIYNTPLIMQLIAESVACRTIAGVQYHLADLQVECDDSTYFGYKFGVMAIFSAIWVVLINFLIFGALKKLSRKTPKEMDKDKQKKGKLLQKQIGKILAKRSNRVHPDAQVSDVSSIHSEACEADKNKNDTFINDSTSPLKGQDQKVKNALNENDVNKALEEEVFILDQTDSLQTFGYLYIEFFPEKCHWDIYRILMRVLVTAGVTFYHKDVYLKGIAAFLLLFIYGAFVMRQYPYKQKPHWKLDLYSIGVINLSILSCLFLKGNGNEYMYFTILIVFAMVCYNLIFILYVCTEILQTTIKKIIVEANNSKAKKKSIQRQKDMEREIKVIQGLNENIKNKEDPQYLRNLDKIANIEREIGILEYTYEVDANGKEVKQEDDPIDVKFINCIQNRMRFILTLFGYPSQEILEKVDDLSYRIKRWGQDVFVLGVLSGQIQLQHAYDLVDYDEENETPYSAAYVLSGRLTEIEEQEILENNQAYLDETSEWNEIVLGHLVKLASIKIKELKYEAKYWDNDDDDDGGNNNGKNTTVNQSSDNFLENKDQEYKIAKNLINQLDKDEVARHFEAFKLFESHGRGYITKNDLALILKTLGQNVSGKDLSQMVAEIDQDGNEQIDFCEFIALIALKKTKPKHHEIVREMYQWFDLESDGNLGVKEVRSMLKKLLKEESIPDKIIYEFIQNYDQDKDVQLSYGEFVRLVT